MTKFLAMTAVALVLCSLSAHAEYTGSGAISSSSAAGGSGTDSSSDAAKQRLKDDWDKFKNAHEQTWEKLEAARRAHWHGVGHHDGDATDDNAGPAPSADTAGGSGAVAPDTAPGPKPSKWERFKENHQDQKQALQDHVQDMKDGLDARKDEARSDAKDWAAQHKGKVAEAKEKVQQWESDHKDKIDTMKQGMKDKWEQWHAGH